MRKWTGAGTSRPSASNSAWQHPLAAHFSRCKEKALPIVPEDDRRYLASVPESLPPAFRAPLLQSLVQNQLVERSIDALPFITRFGSAVAPALSSNLDHEMLGWAAAICLWDWNPENAERLLRQSEKFSMAARRKLLDACPASHVAAAVEALLAEPTLFDTSERLSWARKRLPKAGSEVERLIAIMKID